VWVRFIQNFLVSKLLASILPPAQVATIFGVLANVENSKFMALVKPFNETLPNVVYEPVDMSYIYFNYAELAVAAIVFSVILSCYLYAASFLPDRLLAEHGNTGNRVYDFFIGRELNPRIGGFGDRDAANSASTAVGFDLKCFCELRPGLIGWVAINLGCLCAQLMIRKQQSITPLVTPEMMLINVFQGIYVWDALVNERAILTTMDITTDGFGFMLAFGDLAWVPFTYSLQARYLVENDAALSSWELVAICLLKALGYWIFRGSNGEKDAFRRDPTSPAVAHLRTMETNTGRKLLISGWWGAARKINYTGDWLMGLSWCLLTGGTCIATYFYSIYFAILLIHRAMRDEHACRRKYGPFWDEYKKAVPYVFIPGVI